MKTRIITGVILIAAVLAWLFLAGYEIFALGALFMYMVGAWEMGPLIGFKSRLTFLGIAAAAACVVFYFAVPGNFTSMPVPRWCFYLVASGLVVWVLSLPLLYKFPAGDGWHKSRLLGTIFALLMLVPFLMGLLILRADSFASDPRQGAFLVAGVMALAIAADTGAYFTGRAIGKTPMIPRVSPHKTMEGLAGGILLALIVMVLLTRLGWYSDYGHDLARLLIAGGVTVLFSVVGDLVESMLKRMAGIKDSGRIFPGHGGMLDRIDSQLASIPVFITMNLILGNVAQA
ncbi:MAG: phosphatidate cytidylyltransferase [Succinivibrio sp.]